MEGTFLMFAPILDPAAYSSAHENPRRRAVAAGNVLQALADGQGDALRSALKVLDEKDPSVRSSRLSKAVSGALEKVVRRTGIDRAALLRVVEAQLNQVKDFTRMDGDSVLEDPVAPVIRLLQSGRIELFAASPELGDAARPTDAAHC